MSGTTQKIKERLGVVDVIGSYLKLEKAGTNYKAKCPFHNEKTASFFVSPQRESFYCFGCGVGGDIFSFVEQYESTDFLGALKILAEKAGVPIQQENIQERKENEVLYQILETAVSYYQKNLETSPEVLLYLKERGLKENTIKDFRIGFAKDGWRNLLNYLTSLNFKEEDIWKAGLIKKSAKGYYDTFRKRIMFPISDSVSRPVAFSGRIWGNGEEAKYLNSPETKLFNKSETLYGYDKAKRAIRDNNYCLLVEGQMDLLLAHQEGYPNTVAASGTAFSGEIVEIKNDTPYTSRAFAGTELKSSQINGALKIIKRLTSNLFLAFDSDRAGIGASGRIAKLALPMDFNLKVVKIPFGLDPAEMILKDKEAWDKAVKEAKHIVDFFLDIIGDSKFDSRRFALEVRRRILPYVSKIQNKIDKDLFIRKIAELVGVSENSIREEIEKLEFSDTPFSSEEKIENLLPIKSLINKKIAALEFYLGHRTDAPISAKVLNEEYKKISGERIPQITKEEAEPIILEIERMVLKEENSLEMEANELLLRFEREVAEEKLDKEIKKMKEAEKEKDEEGVEEHLKSCQDITNRINELNKGTVNYF